MLPPEIAAALPKTIDPSRVTAYARLHAAIDSPLGESHLVAAGSTLVAITRRSPFDPFAIVELAPEGLRYEKGTFSRTLFLETATGAKHTMDVSILDVETVEAFTRPHALGGSMVNDVMSAQVSRHDDRATMRAAFLGVLRDRKRTKQAEPFPGEERYHLTSKPQTKPIEASHDAVRSQPKPKKKNAPKAAAAAALSTAKRAPKKEPLFTTMHWVALVVLIPILIAAFKTLGNALR